MTDKHDILEALRKMYRDNGENAEAMQMVEEALGSEMFNAVKLLKTKLKEAGVKHCGFWNTLEIAASIGLLAEKKR